MQESFAVRRLTEEVFQELLHSQAASLYYSLIGSIARLLIHNHLVSCPGQHMLDMPRTFLAEAGVQPNQQTNTTDRQTDRQTERQTERQTHTDKQRRTTGGQAETDGQIGRERRTDTQTDRQRPTDRQKGREDTAQTQMGGQANKRTKQANKQQQFNTTKLQTLSKQTGKQATKDTNKFRQRTIKTLLRA